MGRETHRGIWYWSCLLASVFGFVHLATASCIEAVGGETLMLYLAIDAPLVWLTDSFPLVSRMQSVMPREILGIKAHWFLVLFGSVMYAVVGALVGAAGALTVRKLRPHRETGKCSKCGYDLTENISGKCSECGCLIRAGR